MFTTVSLIFASVCLVPAIPKLTAHPRMRASAAHFGIAWQQYQLIGVAELAAAAGVLAGLVWQPIGLLAGACMAVLLVGAALTHIRTADTGRQLVPPLLVLAIDALYLAVGLKG